MLPADFDVATNAGQPSRTLVTWQALDVRRADGGAFPTEIESAALVLPSGATSPAFLVYANYQVLLKWNRSTTLPSRWEFADQLGKK